MFFSDAKKRTAAAVLFIFLKLFSVDACFSDDLCFFSSCFVSEECTDGEGNLLVLIINADGRSV